MASLPWFSPQFFDNNGKPLAGGKITFYIAGSALLNTIYLDFTLSSPAPNPQILTSGGRFPHQIFFGNVLYDIKIQDSNDVIIDNPLNIQALGGGGSGGFSDHMVMIDSSDATADYLGAKVASAGSINLSNNVDNPSHVLYIDVDNNWLDNHVSSFLFQQGYSNSPILKSIGNLNQIGTGLIKITNGSTSIDTTTYLTSGSLTGYLKAINDTDINMPYALWFNNASGHVINSSSFTIGGPNNPAEMFVPSLIASGSIAVGDNSYWNTTNFWMTNPSSGLQASINLNGANNITFYTHGNLSTLACTWTDLLHVDNLTSGRVPFSNQGMTDDKSYLKDSANFTYTNDQLTLGGANGLVLSYLSGVAGTLGVDTSGHVGFFDSLIKVSNTDLIPGYLQTKIQPGTGIQITKTTDGVNGEVLHVSAIGGSMGWLESVVPFSTYYGFGSSTAGFNMTSITLTPGTWIVEGMISYNFVLSSGSFQAVSKITSTSATVTPYDGYDCWTAQVAYNGTVTSTPSRKKFVVSGSPLVVYLAAICTGSFGGGRAWGNLTAEQIA